jgi:hypothetical protein
MHSVESRILHLGSTKIETGSSVADLVYFGLTKNATFMVQPLFKIVKASNGEELKNTNRPHPNNGF